MKSWTTYFILAMAIIQVRQVQQPGLLASAQQKSWQIIGAADAKANADHNGILVQTAFNSIRHVKFKVAHAPIKIVKVVVAYTKDPPDNIETLFTIPHDGESPVINLSGAGQRRISRIDFWYDMREGDAAVQVTILGMK